MGKPYAALLAAPVKEWSTISGDAGDKLHIGFMDHENERYTLLRDEKGTVLMYDQNEWSAFIHGVNNGEFD